MLIDESTSGDNGTSTLEAKEEMEQQLWSACATHERYYDPVIGRFISDDPIRQASGTNNLQQYVGNDPINHTDPSGHAPPSQNVSSGSLPATILPSVGTAATSFTVKLPPYPAAFSSYREYANAMSQFQAEVAKLDPNIKIGFQGSAVTGISSHTGLAFGTQSDLDMAYVSQKLLDAAKSDNPKAVLSVLLRGEGKTRFGPIGPIKESLLPDLQAILDNPTASRQEIREAVRAATQAQFGQAAATDLGLLDPLQSLQGRIGGRELGGMVFGTEENAIKYAAEGSGTMWFKNPTFLESLAARAQPALRLGGHALQLAGPAVSIYSIARSNNRFVEGQIQLNSQVLGGVATYGAATTGSGVGGITAAGAGAGLAGTFITSYAADYAMQAQMLSDRTEAKMRSDTNMASNTNLRHMAQSGSYDSYERILQVEFGGDNSSNHMLTRFRFWRAQVEGGFDVPMPDDLRSVFISDTNAGFSR